MEKTTPGILLLAAELAGSDAAARYSCSLSLASSEDEQAETASLLLSLQFAASSSLESCASPPPNELTDLQGLSGGLMLTASSSGCVASTAVALFAATACVFATSPGLLQKTGLATIGANAPAVSQT